MSSPTQTEIWKWFNVDNHGQGKVYCKICKKTCSFERHTTSGLINHLKSKHPSMYSLFEDSNKIKQSQNTIPSPGEIVPPQQDVIDLEGEIINGKWDTDNYNSKKIDKLIGEMIALHNLPFNFVEGDGFSRLIEELAPNYNLRGCKFFTNFVCKELYQKVADKVKDKLKKFDYMSFTSDIFSDPSSNASFLTLTCYGIAENFERSLILLKCEIFDDHTGDIMDEKFDTVLSEWNIKKKQVHCLIRDEGSNKKKDMRLAAFNDMDCTVYKIKLAIRNCLHSQDNINIVKQKCKKISAHFKYSTTAQKQLEKIQDRLNQPHLKVFKDGVTPWNRTFDMFDSFLMVKDALNHYINAEIDPILPEEWKIIECCIELLEPFEEAIQKLMDSEALISSVIPIIQVLKKKLEEFLTSHDFDPIRLAITNLKTELSAKFSTLLEENNLYVIATYLDPRYKHKFFSPVTEEKIKADILEMIYAENDGSDFIHYKWKKRRRMGESSKQDIGPGTSGMVRVTTLNNDLAKMLDSSSDGESQKTLENYSIEASLKHRFKKELLSYRKEKRFYLSFSPLKWWEHHRNEFKLLSKIARRFLSPPPTSVTKELLLFSNADSIYEPLRNLEPEKAAIILFIKYNVMSFKFFY